MSKKSVILIILLILLCTALIFRLAAAPADNGKSETGTEQRIPHESESTGTEPPAQPGEGPAGLPTPTV